ncbi:MAG: Hpt domain-containing protein [Desulfobacterales bacterium]|nr:MAG: Hpt domain-containing protein [Desulfobacterales bacterium]
MPIIAVTAHAMTGDEDKSPEAGMNGHLTKSIDPDQLFATLQKWIQPSEKRAQAHQPQVTAERPDTEQTVSGEDELPENLPGFDFAEGLKRLQGNRRLYRKLLLDFIANYIQVAGDIGKALDKKDLKQAHSLVHNLKGLAGNLAATDLQATAVEIEKLVKGESKKAAFGEELNQKFAKLKNSLNQRLETVQALRVPGEDTVIEPSDQQIAPIPAELAKDIAKHIHGSAEMDDVTTLNSIAEELKDRSDSCIPITKRIVQLAEDFDFDGILKLAGELEIK